jgi:hypothetical protein
MNDNVTKMLGMLQPIVEPHYPVPWEIAELTSQGSTAVVCADGNYTCEAATLEAAELIVHCVNTWYKRVSQ